MSTSQKIGQAERFGNALRSTHWSFLMAILWVALTSLAAGAALVLAVGAALCIFAVFACANLAFMSLLVVLAQRQDAQRQAAAGPAPANGAAALKSSFVALPAHARADEITRVLLVGQSYFPVLQGGEVVGTVSKGRLLWANANGYGDRLIAELMGRADSGRPVFVK